MRMAASWSGCYGPADDDPRPMAKLPSDHRPDYNQRGGRARGLSRRGLDAARAERRPTLTGPVRVGLNMCVGRGEETGFQVEQRNWNRRSGEWCKYMLDFKSLIQGLRRVHSRSGLHTRAVTVYRDTLTRGFATSLPPWLLRLLPAGAVAGWTYTHWKAPPLHGAHPAQTSGRLDLCRNYLRSGWSIGDRTINEAARVHRACRRCGDVAGGSSRVAT
jgi:hypothetical protein